MAIDRVSPLERVRGALANGEATPLSVAEECLRRANGNASHNTYTWLDQDEVRRAAIDLERRLDGARPPLYGVPVSLKDCFELAGAPTSAGTRFYAERLGPAARDSVMAARLKDAGMVITGKTHLHPLAYGITGENPDFGDCLQPRDARLLTGGSSSGAVASVQEGSAVIAIGTDTGGSVRVPAALCGLVGFRLSHRVAFEPGRWGESKDGLWAGGIHLAESFDTVGVFARDPRDVVTAVDGIFGIDATEPRGSLRFGSVVGEFLGDCDREVLSAKEMWERMLESPGCVIEGFEPAAWESAQEVFAAIQAHEAAGLHRGHYQVFEPAIAQRLRWGAEITADEVAELRAKMHAFCERVMVLFERYDFLMLPCAPVRQLFAGEDQSGARPKILKYTTPFSLAGLPVLTLAGELVRGAMGTGIQIAASSGEDGKLLGLAQRVGERLAGA